MNTARKGSMDVGVHLRIDARCCFFGELRRFEDWWVGYLDNNDIGPMYCCSLDGIATGFRKKPLLIVMLYPDNRTFYYS